MPGITTDDLLDRITSSQFSLVRLMGMQDGKFCLMLETEEGTFIHEGRDGRRKEYRRVEDVLDWLKRKTRLDRLEIDITLYKENDIRSRR